MIRFREIKDGIWFHGEYTKQERSVIDTSLCAMQSISTTLHQIILFKTQLDPQKFS